MLEQETLKFENTLLKKEIDILMTINKRIDLNMDINSVLNEIIDTILEKVNFDLCSIALIGHDNYMRFHRVIYSKIVDRISFKQNQWDAILTKKWYYKKNPAWICKVAREENELYIPEIDLCKLAPDEKQFISDHGLTSCYFLPIISRDVVHGTILFENYGKTMQLTLYERELIRRRVSMIAQVLDNKKLYNDLKEKQEELERKSKIIDNDIYLASKIHQNFIPKSLPDKENVEIAYRYLPLDKVGGDYFDFFYHREKNFGILMTDASGHGVAAAFITSMIKMSFNTWEIRSIATKPSLVLNDLNTAMIGNIADNFLTAVYCYFNFQKNEARIACGGHPPILIIDKDKQDIQGFHPRGRPLGIEEQPYFDEEIIPIHPGQRFFFYTDGLIESINTFRIPFEAKLYEVLKETCHLTVNQTCETILYELREFSLTKKKKQFDDDIAFVIIDINENK